MSCSSYILWLQPRPSSCINQSFIHSTPPFVQRQNTPLHLTSLHSTPLHQTTTAPHIHTYIFTHSLTQLKSNSPQTHFTLDPPRKKTHSTTDNHHHQHQTPSPVTPNIHPRVFAPPRDLYINPACSRLLTVFISCRKGKKVEGKQTPFETPPGSHRNP